jgi:hypothetical protein
MTAFKSGLSCVFPEWHDLGQDDDHEMSGLANKRVNV